jgi:hypothetical protein
MNAIHRYALLRAHSFDPGRPALRMMLMAVLGLKLAVDIFGRKRRSERQARGLR